MAVDNSSVEGVSDEADTIRSPLRELLRDVVGSPAGLVVLAYLALLLFVAVFATRLMPFDPYTQTLSNRLQGMSAGHWLGTDELGRDVFSRMISATRIALIAPTVAVAVALAIGLPTGLLAGFRKSRLTAVFDRIADTLLSLPPIVAAIAIIAVLGPGLVKAMLAIGLVYSPRIYRIVRGATMSVARETYVESAKAIGCSSTRILWGHCLPNILAPLLVQISLMLGFALLAESSLSFLGLGVQLPEASWGSMLRSASQHQIRKPYGVVAPGVAISVTILAFNVLGDVVRDALAKRGNV
ncbi:oligopeptide ABC transporter permease protein [Ilumatobacter coccineus YM16-304]|uniref:Oligopeptide ABC transporter permease protein n=2 Tax=Ilumatobacter coccineus TaxID=467094 RepID=A0A6C7E6D8_ILUCY|nr:oligopeptide ABC transporter permease protein [Ilumatobacter coccineus YM16-304]